MRTKATVFALLTVFAFLCGVYIVDRIEREQQKERFRAEVLSQLSTIQAKLEGGLNSRLFLEKGMIAFVLTHLAIDPQHQITQAEVDQFGQEFMPQLFGIRNITLIQNNTITHVYPLGGNEKAIGVDLSRVPDQRAEVQKVAQTRRSLLAGPVGLAQGGVGLINRTPIYWTPQDGTEPIYWGQASLVLMQDLLFREASLYDWPELRFAVRGRNGLGAGGEVFWGDETVFQADPVVVEVGVSNGSWQLAAVPVAGWSCGGPFFYWLWLVGGFISFSSGALVWFSLYSRSIGKSLQESEEQFRQMFNKQQAMMWLADPATLMIIDANEAAQQFYGYSLEEFRQKRIADIASAPEEKVKKLSVMLRQNRNVCLEDKHRLANGELRDVEVQITLITLKTKEFFFDIIHDITERKQAEARLKYVSFHDSLTGLYNRSYFEETMQRLAANPANRSIGLMICDLDGLKMVNDTLGHEYGDQLLISTANILTQCLPGSAVVARIGGDEFAVVLDDTTEAQMEECCQTIRHELNNCNVNSQGIPMSVSVGSALAAGSSVFVKDLYKEADNNMYREKLHRGQSARSAVVQTVMRLLEARDFITEGHADRLQDMVSSLGQAVGLPEGKLADLRLLAQFHDIGKVGIPDRILLKPGPLTKQEFIEMQRHCEIGHRIALSSPDLAPIAEWILKHHEWWNGGGYPLGLAGDAIPLESRILAIADAYDAMTSNRPYRSAMSREAAVAELKRCAGTQFDRDLVDKFCRIKRREIQEH